MNNNFFPPRHKQNIIYLGHKLKDTKVKQKTKTQRACKLFTCHNHNHNHNHYSSQCRYTGTRESQVSVWRGQLSMRTNSRRGEPRAWLAQREQNQRERKAWGREAREGKEDGERERGREREGVNREREGVKKNQLITFLLNKTYTFLLIDYQLIEKIENTLEVNTEN